jgi:hypothetical protein
VYVKESYCKVGDKYYYKADGIKLPDGYKWKSGRFMPFSAARTFLQFTEVFPQRIQEISEEDAIAEGVLAMTTPNIQGIGRTCIQGFGELWNTIYRKDGHGWSADPWVWAYRFIEVERPV